MRQSEELFKDGPRSNFYENERRPHGKRTAQTRVQSSDMRWKWVYSWSLIIFEPERHNNIDTISWTNSGRNRPKARQYRCGCRVCKRGKLHLPWKHGAKCIHQTGGSLTEENKEIQEKHLSQGWYAVQCGEWQLYMPEWQKTASCIWQNRKDW